MSDSASAPALLERIRSLAQGRQWQTLVELASEVPESELLGEPEAAFHYADALHRVGRPNDSLDLALRLEAAVRPRASRSLTLNLVNVVGICLYEMGRNPEAEERFGELLELASEWDDEDFAARAYHNIAMISFIRGRRDLALTYFNRALATYRRLGRTRGLAQSHHNLAICYRDLGLVHDADAHCQKAIQLAQSAGSEDVIALAESERAYLRARSGDGVLAEALATRALGRFDRIGDPLGRAEATRVLAAAARTRGDEELAAERLEEALAVARAHADPMLRAEIQRDRGLLLRDREGPAAAREALADAADHFAMVGAAAEAEAMRAIAEALAD